ncbi:MAG: A/G-specific adenine glycosylase [Peptococcaceae bacterium]|nr:A/G-specific adenine glycosylase [Peptococcaceae bacterium]
MAACEFAPELLKWYAEQGRELPWRVKGPHPDPYAVWISEIMLQQTPVVTVVPYFSRFMERFPDIATLASASVDDVLGYWQGLGYYRRAHHLHTCAQVLRDEHGGCFPKPLRPEELRKLPGIGPYSSASIAALAFGMRAAAVDGNVARILSRLYCVDVPVSTVKDQMMSWAQDLLPVSDKDMADYTSAIMDMGAMICRPKSPGCSLCPWQRGCGAYREGECERYPVTERREKKKRWGYVFWLEDEKGRVLVRRRVQGSLLSGLREFPWVEVGSGDKAACGADPAVPDPGGDWPVCWQSAEHRVRHTFTHFHLTLHIVRGRVDSEVFAPWLERGDLAESGFVAVADFGQYPFSRLMGKVIEAMTQEASKQCPNIILAKEDNISP